MKKLFSILLCVAVIFAFTACGDDSNDAAVAGIEYHHYNTTNFNEKCDELKKLAESDASGNTVSGDARGDKVITIYDKLYSEYKEMDTLYSVIYVKYSTDITNDYYSDEQNYAYNTLIKSSDKLCGICREITESPYADKFKEHVGEDAFKKFADYDVMTKEEKKLVRNEKKLVDDYYEAIEKANSDGYTYKNEKWTSDEINGEDGDKLALSDYNGYIKVNEGIQKNANKATGPIFIKLVKIRDHMADLYGYDSYADYADKYTYYRDYTPEELEQLYSDVKDFSSKYYKSSYSDDSSESSGVVPDMSANDLVKTLQKYSVKIDKMAGDSCDLMINKKLYSIGDEECRQDGAFTTYIDKAKKPYISMMMDHSRDFIVLTHEFGHFVEYNVGGPQSNVLVDEDNTDLSEIASNGFEGLMTNYYGEIFGKKVAEEATKKTVDDLIENITDGCIYDEFQREVYANPDMTLDEINKTFSRINAEYNNSLKGDLGYSWVYVNHNFEVPMYYISYAVSGLAALQIWDMSQKDFNGAVDTWEKVIKEGPYNKQYLEVLDNCGLDKFTDEGVTKAICEPALKAVKAKEKFDFQL